jgi:hypothetical protein
VKKDALGLIRKSHKAPENTKSASNTLMQKGLDSFAHRVLFWTGIGTWAYLETK